MNRTLFGTDGVRGLAGRAPMRGEDAFALGRAAARTLANDHAPHLLIARDTRRSGTMLLSAFAAGAAAVGARVTDLGVLPTPGVSHLVHATGATAGAVVSASHNPYADNGIKLFGATGEKLPDAVEATIEQDLAAASDEPDATTGARVGVVEQDGRLAAHYEDFLVGLAPNLSGLKVVLDCAHGAASELAPRLFARLGANVHALNAKPDGVNINVDCGSTHPSGAQQAVVDAGADVGVTFDGDADRALLIDRRGRLFTGDHILAVVAGVQGDRDVVGTIMTNLGVERFLQDRSVRLHRTKVGDRYVLERLKREGWRLGGEASGHVLFRDLAPTGDGLLTALRTLAAVTQSGRSLDAWVDDIPIYPQRITNVAVPAGVKSHVADLPDVQDAVAALAANNGAVRVNVRASGTEPLVRVMVEAEDAALVERASRDLAAVVEAAAQQA